MSEISQLTIEETSQQTNQLTIEETSQQTNNSNSCCNCIILWNLSYKTTYNVLLTC